MSGGKARLREDEQEGLHCPAQSSWEFQHGYLTSIKEVMVGSRNPRVSDPSSQMLHLGIRLRFFSCHFLIRSSLRHWVSSVAPHTPSQPFPSFPYWNFSSLRAVEWLETQETNETCKFIKLRSWNSQDSESQKVYKTFIQSCARVQNSQKSWAVCTVGVQHPIS